MSHDDLRRIEELFQAAADLPVAERAKLLDAECGEDAGLRTHLDELLARLEQGASMTSPAASLVAAAGPFPSAPIPEGPGATIGRYKLLQVIGEGGFGVVYMAEQQEPVIRKVALKIIKLGMDTREVIARFEAERQALAMMDHPNIARVLDGGATASGRPYFVMELVRGVAITEYCDKNDLGTQPRLELFVQICQAVQHAHQKGVIHRDLKPSNVLVTLHDGKPMPKVIDFGVAKAIHTRLTEKTLFTRYEQFIGTPAYMSPEQAEISALDVDTRTDIYALGVLLYELLTGTTPFDSESLVRGGVAEIQRIIREEQPPRPSLRISTSASGAIAAHRGLDAQSLSRHLRGDLDWIVMKALEKERSRRYETAASFGEDIRRFLRKEPVLAGPPGAAYRTRKFLARNRTAVVTVLLVTFALVGGIIGTTLAMIEADRNAERARESAGKAAENLALAEEQAKKADESSALAEEQAARALSVLDFLVSTLSLTDPSVALRPDVTVQTLLARTSDQVSEAFADQPWAEARVRSTIGRAYTSLGEAELAEPQLRRAVELIDELTRDGAQNLPGYDAGEFYQTLWALTNVAFNLSRADAFAVAVRAHKVAIAHIGASHPELAEALETFAHEVQAGAWSMEADAMGDVPAIFRKTAALADAKLSPGDPLWPIVADRFLVGGYVVWYTPHEPLAAGFFGEALEIQRRELPADHPDIANSVRQLAGVLNNLDRSVEAEALIRESIESMRRIHAEGDLALAMAESTLGDTLARQGRYEEAEPIILRSYETVRNRIGDESHWIVIEAILPIVQLYEVWDRPEKAAQFRDALAQTSAFGHHTTMWTFVRPTLGPEHSELTAALDRAKTMCGVVSYMVTPGAKEASELVPLLHEISTLRAAELTVEQPQTVAIARLLLGWANALSPETEIEARRLMATEALAILRPWQDELPLPVAEALALLSSIAAAEGRDDDAKRLALEAWAAVRRWELYEMWYAVTGAIRVGRVLLDQAMYAEAESLLRPGYASLDTQIGDRYVDTRLTRKLLHDLYVAWGRPEEAMLFAEPDA